MDRNVFYWAIDEEDEDKEDEEDEE